MRAGEAIVKNEQLSPRRFKWLTQGKDKAVKSEAYSWAELLKL